MRHRLGLLATLSLLACMQMGCVSIGTRDYPVLTESQFERGEPNDLVDVAANVLSVPSKILLWNKRVDNHCVSLETEQAIIDYMAANGLDSTKVRFNQYDPMGEWKRLGRNTGIPPILRYTVGTFHTLGYTLLPGRLFGGDKYNPYTDTLSVYSDIPAIAMAEVAYAKNLRSRAHRGWYAFGQEFPVLGMHHEGKATTDVLNYLAYGDPSKERAAYEILMPRYGGSWGSTIGDFFPDVNPAGTIAGTIVGHIAGRKKSKEIATVSYEEASTIRGQGAGPVAHEPGFILGPGESR